MKQEADEISALQPWVAILHSAIEPAGRRGGGIQNAVIAQALGLIANGVGARIFTSSEACAADAQAYGIPLDLDRAWHSGIDPLLSARIWAEARRKDVMRPAAVIHNGGRTWLAGMALFPGILNVQVLHRERIPPYRFFRNWIALSENYAEQLRLSMSGRLRRIAVVPNSLMAEPPAMPPRARSGPVVFGTAGRLGEGKGTDVLVEAASLLHSDGIDVRFRVAGPGAKSFEAMARQMGVSDIVEFVGWIDDMDDFLASIDVFLLPSRKEAFGLVLIEAMANGVPVISSRTNGALDIVDPDQTGWLVPIGDAQAMAEMIGAVASDRVEIARRGAEASRVAREEFMPRPVGRKLIAALAQLGAPLDAGAVAAAPR